MAPVGQFQLCTALIVARVRVDCNRKLGSHAEGQLPHSLYPPHENRNMEARVRERHLMISEEVGNLERTKDGTNKMRDISKRPN